MNKKAIVWSKPMCSQCQNIKELLKKKGYDFEDKKADDLLNGRDLNLLAIKQLADQNFTVPVVCINDGFMNPDDAEKFLDSL